MAVREHRYRITVEHIGTPREDQPLRGSLTFEDGNHDDLFRIVELQRASGRFASDDEAAAFAIGLKLLGEAVLRNRDDALLQQLKAPIGDFIQQLKAAGAARAKDE
jgi:hypothetical protein